MLVLKLRDISFIYHYASHTICFIYKSCTLVFYSKEWLLESYEIRKFNFFYLNIFTFLKGKNVCIIEKIF
jgi:hypothetical protein